MNIDIIRAEFPAIGSKIDGQEVIYFDNPAGTQVSRRVIRRMEDAMVRLMLRSNATAAGGLS